MDTFSPVDLLDNMYLSSFVYASPFGSPSRSRILPADEIISRVTSSACLYLSLQCRKVHFCRGLLSFTLDAWDWSLVSSDGEEDGQCHLEGDRGGRGAGTQS